MAHNLKTNTDGKVAMIYTGETPWHQLGTACPEAFTAEEAMTAFPFTYRKEPVYRIVNDDLQEIESHQAVVISDTNETIGMVSPDFEFVQPQQCFDFMNSVSETGALQYETVGALGKGEKIWLMAKTPNNIVEIIKGDPIEKHLLFSTGYDGRSSNQMRGVSTRVVCQNTLDMATKEAPAFINIRHTGNVHEKLAVAAEIMQSYERQQESFIEAMTYLAKHPITDEIVAEFMNSMFGDPDMTEAGRGLKILELKREKFSELLITGKGTEIKGVAGTMYGLVNAYTEWSDWFSSKKPAGERTKSIVFGLGATAKSQALELALTLAGR